MITSFKDASIFNTVNPSALEPKSKKPMPFPLENFDSEISDAYFQMSRILTKLKAAEENPTNHTPARKRRLKSLQYKTKSCLGLIKEISRQCSELWF
jgi:hypothetical protein